MKINEADPGKINMASAGIATPSHVAGELFKMMTGRNGCRYALTLFRFGGQTLRLPLSRLRRSAHRDGKRGPALAGAVADPKINARLAEVGASAFSPAPSTISRRRFCSR